MKRRLILLVLLSPLLMADTCGGDDNPCTKPFPEVGAVVTTAEVASDPCTGQAKEHVLMWFSQGGVRYPLRCGLRDSPKTSKQGTRKFVTCSGGWGYLHIGDDAAADGTVGHGDRVNDKAFAAAMQHTLTKGKEALQGGPGSSNWRYTVEYTALTESCTDHWGFRVVLAKAPPFPDGPPAGHPDRLLPQPAASVPMMGARHHGAGSQRGRPRAGVGQPTPRGSPRRDLGRQAGGGHPPTLPP